MTDIINRRSLMAAGAFTLFVASLAHAEDKPLSPMQWTDQFGVLKDLPKDKDPLTDELKKYPRCHYCGMERAKFTHSRHLIVYEDDAIDCTCSLHCAAVGLSVNMDRGLKAIYAGDAGAEAESKPLVNVDQATYVVDPSKPGVMTKVSVLAYADKAKAEAVAKASSQAEAVGFDQVLRKAYMLMADDTIMLRQRRSEMRKKM